MLGMFGTKWAMGSNDVSSNRSLHYCPPSSSPPPPSITSLPPGDGGEGEGSSKTLGYLEGPSRNSRSIVKEGGLRSFCIVPKVSGPTVAVLIYMNGGDDCFDCFDDDNEDWTVRRASAPDRIENGPPGRPNGLAVGPKRYHHKVDRQAGLAADPIIS
eukprot:5283883-Pyramimonas_sp.AAC.1